MVRNFSNLTTPRLVLWCYLLWYVVVALRYFDPNPRLWVTSLGLSVIIGFALILNPKLAMPARAFLGTAYLSRLTLRSRRVTLE